MTRRTKSASSSWLNKARTFKRSLLLTFAGHWKWVVGVALLAVVALFAVVNTTTDLRTAYLGYNRSLAVLEYEELGNGYCRWNIKSTDNKSLDTIRVAICPNTLPNVGSLGSMTIKSEPGLVDTTVIGPSTPGFTLNTNPTTVQSTTQTTTLGTSDANKQEFDFYLQLCQNGHGDACEYVFNEIDSDINSNKCAYWRIYCDGAYGAQACSLYESKYGVSKSTCMTHKEEDEHLKNCLDEVGSVELCDAILRSIEEGRTANDSKKPVSKDNVTIPVKVPSTSKTLFDDCMTKGTSCDDVCKEFPDSGECKNLDTIKFDALDKCYGSSGNSEDRVTWCSLYCNLGQDDAACKAAQGLPFSWESNPEELEQKCGGNFFQQAWCKTKNSVNDLKKKVQEEVNKQIEEAKKKAQEVKDKYLPNNNEKQKLIDDCLQRYLVSSGQQYCLDIQNKDDYDRILRLISSRNQCELEGWDFNYAGNECREFFEACQSSSLSKDLCQADTDAADQAIIERLRRKDFDQLPIKPTEPSGPMQPGDGGAGAGGGSQEESDGLGADDCADADYWGTRYNSDLSICGW